MHRLDVECTTNFSSGLIVAWIEIEKYLETIPRYSIQVYFQKLNIEADSLSKDPLSLNENVIQWEEFMEGILIPMVEENLF
jgi:hypothetical protein